MLNAISDCLSELASSDDEENGEDQDDEEEDSVGGKLSEDDEPSWVMGTISKTVQYRMQRFRQKQITLDELTQPGWGDAADYLCERDKKYGTTEWKVPAVVQFQKVHNAASPAPTRCGEHMEILDRVARGLRMPQVTSRPASCHIRLGSQIPQTLEPILALPPAAMPDSSPIQKSNHVEPVIFDPCISRPNQITI